VRRSRVFEFLASGELASGELSGVTLGKRRLVPRRSLDALRGRIGAYPHAQDRGQQPKEHHE